MKVFLGILISFVMLALFSIPVYAEEASKDKDGIITLRNGDLKIHAGTFFTVTPASYGDWGHGVRMEFKIGDNGQPILFWVAPLYGGRNNSYSILVGIHLQF